MSEPRWAFHSVESRDDTGAGSVDELLVSTSSASRRLGVDPSCDSYKRLSHEAGSVAYYCVSDEDPVSARLNSSRVACRHSSPWHGSGVTPTM